MNDTGIRIGYLNLRQLEIKCPTILGITFKFEEDDSDLPPSAYITFSAYCFTVARAGGKVTRISGKSYSIFDPDILASNGRIHKAMQAALTKR